MVKSATGVAAVASMATTSSTGPGRPIPSTPQTAPRMMAQGIGLTASRRSEATSSAPRVESPAWSRRESTTTTDWMTTMSMSRVALIVPPAAGPTRAMMSGIPMKPELLSAATSPPKAASSHPVPRRLAGSTPSVTTTRPATSHRPSTTGSSSVATGVSRPSWKSIAVSAK